jgi:hypothetical protein
MSDPTPQVLPTPPPGLAYHPDVGWYYPVAAPSHLPVLGQPGIPPPPVLAPLPAPLVVEDEPARLRQAQFSRLQMALGLKGEINEEGENLIPLHSTRLADCD